MTSVHRSVAWSAAQNYLSVVLQLASTMVLSRVLTPTEVGVFAVAAVFSALASNFRDFGVAEYLIQAKELSHRHIRAAFAANLGVSWLMAALIFAGSYPAGSFYRNEGITLVMQVQALNFVLIPFGAINMAWFRRQMDFRPMFIAGLLSDVLSLSVAVVLALRGHGALSLAWSSVTGILVTVLVSMAFRPKDFPRWPSLDGLKEVLQFGSLASVTYMLSQLGRSAPEMVIGRVQSVTDVAIFSRATGLVQLFRQLVVRALNPVCLPFFAKSLREQGTLNPAYQRWTAIFTGIGWPVLGFMALAAFPAIRIVYGDQWLSAVPLAQLLCLAAAVELTHLLAKEALIAKGMVKEASELQMALQAAQLVGLAAVIPFGLPGACWGMLAAAAVGVALAQRKMRAATGFEGHRLWAACRGSLLVTTATLLPMAVIVVVYPAHEGNYLRHLLLGVLCATPAWLAALRWLKHPLWEEGAHMAAPLLARFKPTPTPPPST